MYAFGLPDCAGPHARAPLVCGRTCGEERGQVTLPECAVPDDDARVAVIEKSGEARGVTDERVARVAIDFIVYCFARRSVEWPQLYDEMCFVAGNRLFKGLGYEELRDAGLDLTLGGMSRTSRLASEVTKQIGTGPLAAALAS